MEISTFIGENSKTYLTLLLVFLAILGPLLFLVYVDDLSNASRLLDPIQFANETNLFLTHKDTEHFFTVVNKELENIKDWFTED